MHSNTAIARRSVWELKTLHITSTNDRISHRKPTTCLYRGCECRQHANLQCNNVPHAHGLFVSATGRGFIRCVLCAVRRRRKNQGKSALYTDEMRYLRRFVQLANAARIQACRPPIAYRTHSNALQRLSVATGLSFYWCRSTPRIAADLRQLIATLLL
jgi:hypothetical protein